MKNYIKSILTIAFLATFSINAATSEFSILTLNTGLLALTVYDPIFKKSRRIAEVGNLQNNEKRAEKIANTILALNRSGRGPDVILLQEAFDTPTLEEKIIKPLKKAYPFIRMDERSGKFTTGVGSIKGTIPVGTNSGLTMFSKFPLKKTMLKDFTCFAGEGSFARKGLMGAEILVNNQPVYLFTTHLQAGMGAKPFKDLQKKGLLPKEKGACVLDGKSINVNNPELTTREIRRAELQQAKIWMEEFATDKTAPIILGGDLNLRHDRPDFADISAVFPNGQILFNAEKSAPNTGSVWHYERKEDGSFNRKNVNKGTVDQGNLIDYLIIIRNPGNKLQGDAWIIKNFGPDQTDHLGYFGEFKFSK